jgi:tripartite ATP-independent transporter DctP family solute receptor
MKKNAKVLMLTLLITSFLSLSFVCSSFAAKYELRLGHDQSIGHPYDLGVKEFAEKVSAATNGEVKITIYPSAQLGDTAEQIEGLRMGSLDMSLAAFSHASQFIKELGIFGAPFLFTDDAHFAAVFDGEVGEILNQASLNRYKVSLLSTFTSGYRLLFNGKREVKSQSDLTGLKIRVMGGQADALTWEVFGAIPTPMPYSEVYSALQAGVIDGAENEPSSILRNKFYETAPYFTLTKHLVLPMGLFISEKSLNNLPENFQKIVKEEAKKAAVWERAYITVKNAEAIEEMTAKYNVKVSTVDTTVFMEKGIPIQDQVAKKLDLEDLLMKIRKAGE